MSTALAVDAAWPKFQITTAPDDVTGRVVFDFTDESNPRAAGRRVLRDGWSIGFPEPLGDDDALNPGVGQRTLQATTRISGTRGQALRAHNELARVMYTPGMWVRFQLAPSSDPVWYEIYRMRPGELSFDNVSVSREDIANRSDTATDLWDISIDIAARALAVGPEVQLGTFTIANDPAATGAGVNPISAVLPDVRGDAAAPLRVALRPSVSSSGRRFMVATHAGRTVRRPIVTQFGTGDGFTSGPSTAAEADAGASGGSRRTVSAGNELFPVVRVSGTSTPVPAGTYKVLVRMARSSSDGVFGLRYGQLRPDGSYDFGQTVVTARDSGGTASLAGTWLDLGDFAFPRYGPPPGVDPGPPAGQPFAVATARLTGAADLHLDAMIYLPVGGPDTLDASALYAEFPQLGFGPTGPGAAMVQGIVDADREACWATAVADGTTVGVQSRIAGGWPHATPGRSNVLTVLQQVNAARNSVGADAGDQLPATTEVVVSYQPRFLWVGDR